MGEGEVRSPGRPPIALFIDRGFAVEPFAEALAPAVDCRESVPAAEFGDVEAVVTGIDPVGVAEVEPFPNLRMVLACSTGTDQLDVEALRARGLIVCNTPTYCTEEVADHTLALLLCGWRQVWRLGLDVRRGGWEPGTILRRFDRQRLGIVGCGRIGSAVARRAQALGVEVVAHDPFASPPAGVPALDLDELLATSDAVSLHLPGTRGAPPLLGRREVGSMKPGAVLVNVSRTSLVDLDAVVEALAEGRLSGAMFDVWEDEPPRADDPRYAVDGLLVTPHVGWSSPQADDAYREEAIASLRSLLVLGEDPPGRLA